MSLTGWFCLIVGISLLYLGVVGYHDSQNQWGVFVMAIIALSIPLSEHFERWVYEK